MRKTLFVLLLSCFISQLHAKDFSVSGYLEASTAYMFRGSKGCGANVSPCLALKWKGLMLQTYGYVSFDGTYKEVDLELSYSIGPVSFRFGDYYCPARQLFLLRQKCHQPYAGGNNIL